jgi:hypothetical protein
MNASISGWKRIALQGLFIGVGFAIMLSIIAGAALWYVYRPKPPKLWNTHAIVATDPPGFDIANWVSSDGKTTVPVLVLTYTLRNTTDFDYTIESRSAVKFMLRRSDGTVGPDMFSGPIEENEGSQNDIRLPLFIPAKQKALFQCSFSDRGLPSKDAKESDADYHERLRSYLEKTYKISGLVIFDDVNHYEIDLSKWASHLPAGH